MESAPATFILHSEQTWKSCLDFLMLFRDGKEKIQVDIKPFVKTRSTIANSFYWVSLTHYLKEIDTAIKRISDETGYTVLEVKQLVGRELPIERAVILFAKSPEVAHDVLKEINGIPTTTRLGTKAFSQHTERMEQTIAEIAGAVNNFAGRAA